MKLFCLLLLQINISNILSISFKKINKQNNLYLLLGHNAFKANLEFNQVSMELTNILPMKLKKEAVIENKNLTYIPLTTKIDSFKNIESNFNEIHEGDLMIYNGTFLVLCNKNRTIENDNNYYVKIGKMGKINEFNDELKNQKNIMLWNNLNYENHKGQVVPYDYYRRIINFLTWKSLTFVCFLLI